MEVLDRGLGEHPSYDGRDSEHLMAPVLEEALSGVALPDEKIHKHGRISDQGSEGACVGHGWTGWLNCTPVRPRQRTQERYYNDEYATNLYHAAQKVDEWPGTDYSGTSARAAAGVMKSRDFLESYIHATRYEDIRAFLLSSGPVVLSCRWDEASYKPDNKGFLQHGGKIVGGHCFLAYGVSKWGTLVCANSWGEDFANEGSFYISKEEWLYRMRLGYWSAISSKQLTWRQRQKRR